jgi:hypothetical protein
MIRKCEILKLIGERSREKRETSYRTLARFLDVSEEAACLHLLRLWQARLIKTVSGRVEGTEYRLQHGESIRDLAFRLSK